MIDKDANLQEQLEISERLQVKVLRYFEKQLDSGTISPTDMATLTRLMAQNGWRFDPHSIPQKLKDKIPNLPKATDFDEDELRYC